MTLSLVTWLWRTPGYRSTFTGEHVNRLAAMARRHYRGELRVICVTDDDDGIDESIEVLRDWRDFASVPSPAGVAYPSCYRRLRGFYPQIGEFFGPRFVALDLDWVITGDVTSLWNRDEDFVGLRDVYWPRQLNGSMWLLRSGAARHVWEDFDPKRSPALARAAGYRGSDQAWISACLPDAPRWGPGDGIYSYRKDVLANRGQLPSDARMVNFHGRTKPWDREAQELDWVRERW